MPTRLTLSILAALLAGFAAAEEPAEPEETVDAAESGAEGEADTATPEERLTALLDALGDEEAADSALLERRIAELWSQSGSDSMDFLLSRGRDAMQAENYDRAVDHLSALIELAPEFAEGWNTRATAFYLSDDYWRSMADIQRALALEPRHFGALSGLGAILERTGDDRGALAAYREALRVNPHLANAERAVDRLAAKVDGRDI